VRYTLGSASFIVASYLQRLRGDANVRVGRFGRT
jgi:hypothetical protein